MKDVFETVSNNRISYQGDPEPEEARGAGGDWRAFLDTVQERTGSSNVESVLTTYVLTDHDRALLPDRTAARTKYAALAEAGRGWSPPLPVRYAMSSWSFSMANGLMDDAMNVLHTRDDIKAKVAKLGLTVPESLERSYESDELNRSGPNADALLRAKGKR